MIINNNDKNKKYKLTDVNNVDKNLIECWSIGRENEISWKLLKLYLIIWEKRSE